MLLSAQQLEACMQITGQRMEYVDGFYWLILDEKRFLLMPWRTNKRLNNMRQVMTPDFSAGVSAMKSECVMQACYPIKALAAKEIDICEWVLGDKVTEVFALTDEAQVFHLIGRMEGGARIITARLTVMVPDNPPTWFHNEENGAQVVILPEARRPKICLGSDWLYHRENLTRPDSALFAGMRAGVMDAMLYTGVNTGCHMEARGKQIPDVTHAIAIFPGDLGNLGYQGGFTLGEYHVGKGTLFLCAFSLLDHAHDSPYAAQLLVNLLA